jgi:nucleoporin NUP42
MQTALNDVDGAINYIIKAENEHPNRIDICRESQASSAGSRRGVFLRTEGSNTLAPPSQPAAASTFGASSQPGAFGQLSGGAFGQPAALGQRPNPFGAPSGAFGQSSGGAFGQPSALGQKPNPFGASVPVFGSTTQLGGGGAFGQPSALGQKPNPFGGPSGAFSQPSGGAFGQPSALGQKPNPFGGQPAAPVPFRGTPQATQANPFGAPSGQTQNPFGAQNPLAQPNPFVASTTPFGAPSPAPKNPFGAPSQPPNPFGGTPTTQPNPFGAAPAPAPAPSNPFGNPQPNPQPAPNPFGNPQPTSQQASNPFGNPQQTSQQQALNPFGNPPPSAPTPPNANPFGALPSQASQSFTNGVSSVGTEHPPVSSYSTRDASGRLLTFKDKRVVYKDSEPGTQSFDGAWEKIWFPDGPPPHNKWAEAEPEKYTEEVKTAYENARRNGVFDGGVIPLVPPKQAWCQWDF